MNEAYIAATKYIDSWLGYYLHENRIPGLSIAIRRDNELIFEAAYGYTDVQKREKLTSQHIFRIASHSKMFTAVSLLQLQEQGLLRIDDPVCSYIDWLAAHTDRRWKNVTIRQLLSHGAGVIRDGENADYWSLDFPFPNSKELKDIVLQSDLVLDNNVQLKYSNIGFSLLGMIIESVTGHSYNEYVKKNIITPLELKNTYPEYDDALEVRVARQHGRLESDGSRKQFKNISTNAMASATGFCSTAADLALFSSALLLGNGKLLSDESKKEMQRSEWKTPKSTTEEYGLGICIDTLNDKRLIGHGGGFPGHTSRTIVDPESKLTVVILINAINEVVKPLVMGSFQALEWFGHAHVKKSKHDLSKFNGRFTSIWGDSDIIAYGNSAISVWPGSWNPFADYEELEYHDDDSLKIVKAHGHASQGELIIYTFDAKNKVIKIVYAGATMRPL